ncbi:hypothetical protein BDN72DRAFT_286273 [Pluteus cervinus]|uniref:Uncharacterized protein n=1 Tax=Pluteus cervinus TaxID=181527 RepID=A0ACD3ADT1_9AGAR|nr:hypothetical protein BDN72DRAFT_286273 [Pluteus cervinus]
MGQTYYRKFSTLVPYLYLFSQTGDSSDPDNDCKRFSSLAVLPGTEGDEPAWAASSKILDCLSLPLRLDELVRGYTLVVWVLVSFWLLIALARSFVSGFLFSQVGFDDLHTDKEEQEGFAASYVLTGTLGNFYIKPRKTWKIEKRGSNYKIIPLPTRCISARSL